MIVTIIEIRANLCLTKFQSLLVSDAQYGSYGLGSVWSEEDVESVESLHWLEKDAPMRRPQVRLRAHHRDSQHQQPVADGG